MAQMTGRRRAQRATRRAPPRPPARRAIPANRAALIASLSALACLEPYPDRRGGKKR